MKYCTTDSSAVLCRQWWTSGWKCGDDGNRWLNSSQNKQTAASCQLDRRWPAAALEAEAAEGAGEAEEAGD
jgi:hypothetical protein